MGKLVKVDLARWQKEFKESAGTLGSVSGQDQRLPMRFIGGRGNLSDIRQYQAHQVQAAEAIGSKGRSQIQGYYYNGGFYKEYMNNNVDIPHVYPEVIEFHRKPNFDEAEVTRGVRGIFKIEVRNVTHHAEIYHTLIWRRPDVMGTVLDVIKEQKEQSEPKL